MSRNRKVTDRVFDVCVLVLIKASDKLGITYKEINVALFVVAWPVITVGLTYLAIKKKK